MIREDGRSEKDLRDIKITRSFMKNAHGSAFIEWGKTRVLCTAMYTAGVPSFLEGTDRGWLTAEYAMLPASTPQRKPRELKFPDGRSTEISRLIGRSLRSVFDVKTVAGYTINIDCDVIDADGGTRTAAITGAYIALELCMRRMVSEGLIEKSAVKDGVAAVSCGIVYGKPVCDLRYAEDSRAEADMNIVMSHSGGIIEVQCTGEKRPLDRREFNKLLEYAGEAVSKISGLQKEILGQSE
jgi:ribonuclease PH